MAGRAFDGFEGGAEAVARQATAYLHEAYGADATFRAGQLEAIVDAATGKRVLVVQKTGWGKSCSSTSWPRRSCARRARAPRSSSARFWRSWRTRSSRPAGSG